VNAKKLPVTVLLALLFALTVTAPMTALAEVYPSASRVDSRLRYTTYNPDQVYRLNVKVLHACFIEFAQGEQLKKYYTGDLDAWDVGKDGNVVAIKPKKEKSETNLIMTTNRGRVYVFELAVTDKAPMYGIRFSYPEEERKQARKKQLKQALDDSLDPARQGNRNYAYAGSGDTGIQPLEIFDNGSHTFMRFAESQRFPAVFATGLGGERLVNPTVHDNWLILTRVEHQWCLRDGPAVLCIRNDGARRTLRDNPGETTHGGIMRTAK
jgi:type IV secretion system protein VirB9